MRLEKAQYNPSLKLAIDISRAVKAPIEDLFTLLNNDSLKQLVLGLTAFFVPRKED